MDFARDPPALLRDRFFDLLRQDRLRQSASQQQRVQRQAHRRDRVAISSRSLGAMERPVYALEHGTSMQRLGREQWCDERARLARQVVSQMAPAATSASARRHSPTLHLIDNDSGRYPAEPGLAPNCSNRPGGAGHCMSCRSKMRQQAGPGAFRRAIALRL